MGGISSTYHKYKLKRKRKVTRSKQPSVDEENQVSVFL